VLSLSVVYFTEWVDGWLMGDAVLGPGPVQGRRFQAVALTPEQAHDWASRCGDQFPEQQWLAQRLREAADAGAGIGQTTVIAIREVFGPSPTDEEFQEALREVPDWLDSLACECDEAPRNHRP
jgi:hypothetical protein